MLLQKNIISLPIWPLCPPTLCPLLARRLIFSDQPPSPFPFLASADCFQLVAKTELYILGQKGNYSIPLQTLQTLFGAVVLWGVCEQSTLDQLSDLYINIFGLIAFQFGFMRRENCSSYTYKMTFRADLTYEWNSIKLRKCKTAKSLSSNIFTDFTHAINALQYDYYQNIINKISDAPPIHTQTKTRAQK